MTQQQFVEEIRRLSIADRLALIEAIMRSLREDLELQKEGASTGVAQSDQSKKQSMSENRIPLSQRLYGILKFDGAPPTDEELKDHYADYLLEKYS
ncbi:MAG TPA: hypothetical protein VKB86_03560 [Pyrinomonadaceae bacterium]|nr:hypothetical protein [Pyrinomonadaceae bacterium]